MNGDALPPDKSGPKSSRIQGEGDYVSGRRYQEATEKFTKSHDTEKLARQAVPKNREEKYALAEAERKGKARAKGRKGPKADRR